LVEGTKGPQRAARPRAGLFGGRFPRARHACPAAWGCDAVDRRTRPRPDATSRVRDGLRRSSWRKRSDG
jgi:hypothetical protein